MLLGSSIAFFVLGTIMASFAGVIAARLSTGQSVITGRSRCDACTKPLNALSLVPIFSYLFLRGRANCCGAKISFLSPASEILLGTLFVLAFATLGYTAALVPFLIALTTLLSLVLYDLAHQILPPSLMAVFIASAVIASYVSHPEAFLISLSIALVLGGSLALIHVLSRGRAMGLADAPLTFGLSLLVGDAAISGFLFSFWIGAAIGIIILFGRPAGSRMGVEVPFAPFLAAGFLLAYFTQWNPFALIAAFLS